MTSWLNNACKNLLPLSRSADFRQALREWEYRGVLRDLKEEPSFDDCEDEINCELCEHPDIRYQHEIKNIYTQSTLQIGSKCILKFDITMIGDSGSLLVGEERPKNYATI